MAPFDFNKAMFPKPLGHAQIGSRRQGRIIFTKDNPFCPSFRLSPLLPQVVTCNLYRSFL